MQSSLESHLSRFCKEELFPFFLPHLSLLLTFLRTVLQLTVWTEAWQPELEICSSSETGKDLAGLMALCPGMTLWRAVPTPTGLQQMCIALKLGAHQVGSVGGNQVSSSEHCLLI